MSGKSHPRAVLEMVGGAVVFATALALSPWLGPMGALRSDLKHKQASHYRHLFIISSQVPRDTRILQLTDRGEKDGFGTGQQLSIRNT